MTNPADGGAAFPQHDRIIATPDGYAIGVGSPGLSMRDYFAAKAMTVLIPKTDRNRTEWMAQKAYEMADAMLKERAK